MKKLDLLEKKMKRLSSQILLNDRLLYLKEDQSLGVIFENAQDEQYFMSIAVLTRYIISVKAWINQNHADNEILAHNAKVLTQAAKDLLQWLDGPWAYRLSLEEKMQRDWLATHLGQAPEYHEEYTDCLSY